MFSDVLSATEPDPTAESIVRTSLLLIFSSLKYFSGINHTTLKRAIKCYKGCTIFKYINSSGEAIRMSSPQVHLMYYKKSLSMLCKKVQNLQKFSGEISYMTFLVL